MPQINLQSSECTKQAGSPLPVFIYATMMLTNHKDAPSFKWLNLMAIPQHTIDQILDRTDIVDLIGQRVKLKKTGRTYSGCCPFHQEKSPSFHVYRDKQYYHCFGCQANGNAIRSNGY